MHTRLKVAVAVLIAFAANGARAQGIPVIDIANLIQTIQQVLNDITEIQNQVQQITQLQDQLNSINGFRNPSIGLEYRIDQVSVHAGYYITALEPGITTKFVKMGLTYWFLPVGKKENPSSFYAQLSYLRGLNLEYKDMNAGSVDVGFRWMVWKGLHLRIGAAKEGNATLRQRPAEIAAAIQPRPGIRGERIGDEPFRCQLRAVQIAAGEARAADKDLAEFDLVIPAKAEMTEGEG